MLHSVISFSVVTAVCFSWTIGSFESLAGTGAWPTYRHDAQRSGYTAERLGADLAPDWIFQAPHAPDPAWRKHGARMTFDRVYHPVVSGSILLFGSSSDDTVYALDAGTGEVLWTYTTSGPIRFAPTISAESVFVVSDDGCLYSLSLRDGALNWKVRAGPTDSRVLGNTRVISRWPARGAPVVVDGTVYFAEGVWPSEGFFLYAVDADSGQVKWLNEESGSIMPAQPHAGIKEPMGGVSAQGYLAVCKNTLIVPTGRSVPAIFRSLDGSLVYSRGRKHHWHIGGPDVVVFDDYFLNDYLVFNAHSGHQSGRLSDQINKKGRRHWSGQQPNLMVAHPEGLARWTDDGIIWYGWGELAQALAEQTDLHIVAIDPEPSNAEAARKRLRQLGLYGPRVTVLCAELEATELPPPHFRESPLTSRVKIGKSEH